jgi:hypothetical protein
MLLIKIMWAELSAILNKNVCGGFRCVAGLWISNNKNAVTNMITACFM